MCGTELMSHHGQSTQSGSAEAKLQTFSSEDKTGPIMMAKIIGYKISTIFFIFMCKRRSPKQVQVIS